MQGTEGRRRRRRLTPIALTAGVLGSAVLGLGATGTYSSLTATITNSTNTAGTGTLVMRETDDSDSPTTTCTSGGSSNSATCADPNLYGGSVALTPGSGTSTKSVRIYDTGSLDPAAFSMTPGSCTSDNGATGTDPGNICNQLRLTVQCTLISGPQGSRTAGSTSTVVADQTLTSIVNQIQDLKAANCLPRANSAAYAKVDFSVRLDSGATNAVQGAKATQPVVWQFTL